MQKGQGSRQGSDQWQGNSGHRQALNLSMPRPSSNMDQIKIDIVKQTNNDSGNDIPLGQMVSSPCCNFPCTTDDTVAL